MRTGDVAKMLAVSADLIRRIESGGAVPFVQRDRAGQRRFSDQDVERLRLVLYPDMRKNEPKADCPALAVKALPDGSRD
jgi:DNA-binding transcriptional MerR regulator